MTDPIVSPDTAAMLHREAKGRGASPIWIVTTGGSGRARMLVARLAVEQPTSYVLTANTLAEMYAKLPWGLTHSDRQPDDPPEIIEVWFDEGDCPG
jgi:hypothetical protein